MNIKEKAELLLMWSYEYINGVNCFGYCPAINNSSEYQKAKKRVLKNTLLNNDLEIHQYIKENL